MHPCDFTTSSSSPSITTLFVDSISVSKYAHSLAHMDPEFDVEMMLYGICIVQTPFLVSSPLKV
jgi:hypothetical protein